METGGFGAFRQAVYESGGCWPALLDAESDLQIVGKSGAGAYVARADEYGQRAVQRDEVRPGKLVLQEGWSEPD
ncbi:hypothetical protein GC096_18690 [Paenibacillus sp. LMG 31461]|uniref:Uncharacterized protein n=1 Tax=Paenibacillus plantarum TaxID=2654975 RepID=A0ABX1XC82_9BACL|nr:hypothetical protein [Paenibacillus plantarum]NOU66067.1 hypothetical protein [Paenibacillus plantarum]